MDIGTIFSKNIRLTLDILEYAWDTRESDVGHGKYGIYVIQRNIDDHHITKPDFDAALRFLIDKGLVKEASFREFKGNINDLHRANEMVIDPKLLVIADLEAPSDFKTKLKSMRKKFLAVDQSVNSSSASFYNFTLTKEGKLYRTVNGKEQKYKMKKNALRHKFIKELNKFVGDDFCETKKLMTALEATEKEIYRAVAGIKLQIKKKFKGVKGEDFIKSESYSGYRLGSLIRIAEE